MQDKQNHFSTNQAFIWEWFKQNQSQWIQLTDPWKVNGNGGDTASKDGVADDNHFAAFWSKTMQQVFNLPQIGLTRLYQEKINQASESYCRFHGALGKFCLLLSTPLEKACKQVQEKMAQTGEEAASPEDVKVYYDNWIKILEKQYQELFNTAEYIQTLSQTLETMNAFVGAREAVITDALKALPIPSNTDMDALYKEMYHLKKRIKALEKIIAQRELSSCANTEHQA